MENFIDSATNVKFVGEAEGRRLSNHDPLWVERWSDGRNPPAVSAKIREILGPTGWEARKVPEEVKEEEVPRSLKLNSLFDACEHLCGLRLHRWKRSFFFTGRHHKSKGSRWIVTAVPKHGSLVMDGHPYPAPSVVVPEAITNVNAATLYVALLLNARFRVVERKIGPQILVTLTGRDISDTAWQQGGIWILRRWLKNTWRNPILGPMEELEHLCFELSQVSGSESIISKLNSISDPMLRDALFTTINEFWRSMDLVVE